MQATTSAAILPSGEAEIPAKVPTRSQGYEWTTEDEISFIRSFRASQMMKQGLAYCWMILADVRSWDPSVDRSQVFAAADAEFTLLASMVPLDIVDRIREEVNFKVRVMRHGLFPEDR